MTTDVAQSNDGVQLPSVPVSTIWVDTFALTDGHAIDTLSYILPIGNAPSTSPNGTVKSYPDVFTTRAWAIDVDGNLDITAGYCGVMTLVRSDGPHYLDSQSSCDPGKTGTDYPAVFIAQFTPPTDGSQVGLNTWADTFGGGSLDAGTGTIGVGGTGSGGGSGSSTPPSLGGDRGVSLVPGTDSLLVLTRGSGGQLFKLDLATGASLWPPKPAPTHASYSVAAVSPQGLIYVGGTLEPGGAVFPGCEPETIVVAAGLPPFLVVYDQDGNCATVNPGLVACPPTPPGGWPNGSSSPCDETLATGTYRVDPSSITFDTTGNAIVASYGNPAPGGGVAFPLRNPPWTTFPSYSSKNIYLWGFSGLTPRWSKQVPMILSSSLLSMDIDANGHLVVSGNYSGSMLMDDHLLVTGVPQDPGVIDAFLGSFQIPSLTDTTTPLIGVTSVDAAKSVNTVPKPMFTQATGPGGANVFFNPPTALDAGNAGVNVICSPRSSTIFPIGTTTVTCTASDPLGNSSSATFQVTVADLASPVITKVGDITTQATTPNGATVSYTAPSAVDQVDGSRPVTCNGPASGSLFPVGQTTITCTASDLSGHQAQTSFSVTVKPPLDTTPPTVVVPDSMTVEATTPAGATVTYGASATDDVGVVTFACTLPSGGVFAIGTTTVTCTATDAAGHSTTKSFTVKVVDTTKPVLSNVPTSPIVAYATSTAGAKVGYTKPTAKDAVDGNVSVTCTPASGAQFPVNKTTVTCSAADSHGNATQVQFTVWVQYQAPTDGTFFLAPIRADGTSVFAIGRPVPVRFRLTGPGKGITNLVAKLLVSKVSSTAPGTTNSTSDETVDDTDFIFKYKSSLGGYVYRWKTRDQAQGTYRLSVDLGDGVTHQVNVALKGSR
jgi:hypothetical protein